VEPFNRQIVTPSAIAVSDTNPPIQLFNQRTNHLYLFSGGLKATPNVLPASWRQTRSVTHHLISNYAGEMPAAR